MTSPILDIHNVSFSYAQEIVLDSVCFQVFERDFVAVIGPNGGGKSTLIKVIMGLLKPQSGTVSLFGSRPERGRAKVGYLPQFSEIDFQFPICVKDVVLMGFLGRGGLFPSKRDIQAMGAILERVGISHLSERPLSSLSGGEKQRVFLARALLNRPLLLVLDEPTTSVDSAAVRDIYNLLSSLRDEMAIVMISHDLSAVSQLVNRIACLNKRLSVHRDLNSHLLEEVYGCPVALIAHDVPHHHLHAHD